MQALTLIELELPALQRFLRAGAVELISALETPGITATVLRPLFERHEQDFATVFAQAVSLLKGNVSSAQAPEDNFWESSI
jgi:hypothetical protein